MLLPCASLTRICCLCSGETAPPNVITGSGKGISASGGAARLAVGAAVNGRPGENVRALPPVAMMEDDEY